MEPSPGLTRPDLTPTRRRTAALALACSAGLLTIGALIGKGMGAGSARIVPVATPVVVEAPQVPAPVVNVQVLPPPPPAPPAPPEPAPEPPAPKPRALAPHIDAACLVPPEEGEPAASCTWDDGFPAISADGALIARKLTQSFVPYGTGVTIELLDTKTSRPVRRVVLLAETDYEADGKPRPKLAQRVQQRVAAIQPALDAGEFRALLPLGSTNTDPDAPALKRIHAQIDGSAVQIIDPERAVALWQHRFVAEVPPPDDPTAVCAGRSLHNLATWWDPATRLVATELAYATGGCMCPIEVAMELHRIPAAALASR
ncbi:MAG TPA: hypothetical protein VNO30_46475 [Kofleriaceae bacterium]|nr:hypothetical protein [Kofleriaceae bacterium]